MNIKLFDYSLPKKLIAQKQIKPRDYSRLLVLDTRTKKINHRHFYDLPAILNQNDVLVLNQTKVFPARLIGKKITGGTAEIFLIEKVNSNNWQALIGGKRLKQNDFIFLPNKLKVKLIRKLDVKIWQIQFNFSSKKLENLIEQVGQTPLPPYIKTADNKEIRQDYQTIYAKIKGSVAAPTAGLHFTPKLIKQLQKKGIKIFKITLHVGWGTFAPVEVNNITKHQLHHEWVEIDKTTSLNLNKLKQQGKNIVAVGTTTARALEAFCDDKGKLSAGQKFVNIYIYPGYKFKFINSLITNFHLPQSSLLFLVSAFASRKLILTVYQEAIKKKYRFYSFGDAMFIHH
jgi:S-adenosylmethionine:tRNA ribosyltransferase-isomerase